MRKITSLLMLLCMFVGTAWGQGNVSIATIGSNITNLGSLTEGSYVIFKNVGRNGYVYEQGSDNLLRLGNGAVVDGGYEYIWQVHRNEVQLRTHRGR